MMNDNTVNRFVQHLLKWKQIELVQWLQQCKLLKSDMVCSHCSTEMSFCKRSYRMDGYVWHCINCRKEVCIREGSFFNTVPKVGLRNIIHFIWLWANNNTCRNDGKSAFLTRKPASKLCRLLEDICIEALFNKFPTFSAGTFAVDESLFSRRKYNRGRRLNEWWVLGMVNMDMPTKPVFLYIPQRDSRTILRVLRRHIPPGSTVVTDEWAAYRPLSTMRNLQHLTVNHSKYFVDPRTGAHTNHIEGCWRYAKLYLKGKVLRSVEYLQHYLYVYMWRQWYGSQFPGGCFCRVLSDIAQKYHV